MTSARRRRRRRVLELSFPPPPLSEPNRPRGERNGVGPLVRTRARGKSSVTSGQRKGGGGGGSVRALLSAQARRFRKGGGAEGGSTKEAGLSGRSQSQPRSPASLVLAPGKRAEPGGSGARTKWRRRLCCSSPQPRTHPSPVCPGFHVFLQQPEWRRDRKVSKPARKRSVAHLGLESVSEGAAMSPLGSPS